MSFNDKEKHQVLGSGVLVAPGIALCANHVIQPLADELAAGRINPTCAGITSEGMQIWKIQSIALTGNSDIAIAVMKLISGIPSHNHFFHSPITTRTPAIGEELLICGFRASEKEFQRNEKGVEIGMELWVSKGNVTETFPEGRDSVMMPWASLAINAFSTGGMSGGPVYDKYGNLLGLLSSSIDCEDGESISYVSMIWPTLGSKFKGAWPNGIYKGEECLLDLAKRKLSVIDKPEAIIRLDGENGINFGYELWSE